MKNSAHEELVMQVLEDLAESRVQAQVVPFPREQEEGESPFVTMVDEIDAWARMAVGRNGFGDY